MRTISVEVKPSRKILIELRTTAGLSTTAEKVAYNDISVKEKLDDLDQNKVSAQDGYGLSENNYSAADKSKVDNMAVPPSVLIPFSQAIPFNNIIAAMEQNVAAQYLFTADLTNAKPGYRTILVLTANGNVNHIPVFGAPFKKKADSLQYNNINGAKNTIEFLYDGQNCWYTIYNEAQSNLAYRNEVLLLTGETVFTPMLPYHPATKKFTEDKIVEVIANYNPGGAAGGSDLGYYGIQWNENYVNSGCRRTGSLAGFPGGGYYNELAYGINTRPMSNIPENLLFVHNKIKRCLVLDSGAVNYYLDSSCSYNKANALPSVFGNVSSAAPYKLICLGKFTDNASSYVGRYVHNTASGKTNRYAMIIGKDNDDSLNLDLDIFDAGDAFEVHTAVLNGSDGQIMVEIPKFYIRQTYNSGIHTVDISLYPYPGFIIHPAFVEGAITKEFIYYGALEGVNIAGKLSSIPGQVPTGGRTRALFRADAQARGLSWMQEAFWYRQALMVLFYVEYADFNSDFRLPGYINRNAWNDQYRRKTGRTLFAGNQSVSVYSSPFYDADIDTDGNWTDHKAVSNSYRGIENPWGHIFKWLDGININNRDVYASNIRSNFVDDTQAGYDNLNVAIPTNGYISAVHPIAGAFIPSSVSGGNSSYYFCDYNYSSTGWRVAAVGGYLSNGAYAGLAYLYAYYVSTATSTTIGARLCL